MKIAIIDDEKSNRDAIHGILKYHRPKALIDEAESVETGQNLLATHTYDVLFLDVEMADGTGFDLLTMCPDFGGEVIFVTAHNDYAIRAFKFSALDYILKPIDPDEIKKALEKFEERQTRVAGKLDSFFHNWQEGQLERIVLSDMANMHVVELSEIIRCQSVNNYTHFYLADGQELVISTTLKYYEELLAGYGFYRVHQSHIINLKHLVKYNKREGGEAVLKGSVSVPVSSRKKEGLLELLKWFRS